MLIDSNGSLMSRIDEASIEDFFEALISTERVSGLTHNFYRYPARFSPIFVKQAIELFSNEGDLVLDPFVGGGTVLPEARMLGRRSIGTDINELAVFVSRVKTMLLTRNEIAQLKSWCGSIEDSLILNRKGLRSYRPASDWSVRNLSSRTLWPIRKTLELGLEQTLQLSSKKLQDYSRCILLRAGQWAVDGRKSYPSVSRLRTKIRVFGEEMIGASEEYSEAASKADTLRPWDGRKRTRCVKARAENIPEVFKKYSETTPKLILTSPPYPGVHVLYHRWQVDGGKETQAPYWITNKSDGYGTSYYTFGDRKSKELESYYMNLLAVFSNLKSIISRETLIVQLVAFSKTDWQLRRYLETMEQAGYKELKFKNFSKSDDGRLWRGVPNRKWHANNKGATSSSQEVVLMHALK